MSQYIILLVNINYYKYFYISYLAWLSYSKSLSHNSDKY